MKPTLALTPLVMLLLAGLASTPRALSAQERTAAGLESCQMGAIPQIAEERATFDRQYDHARAWVQGLSAGNLPQSYEELIQYTAPARLAIFPQLPAERVRDFWEAHLERYLGRPEVSTPEQRTLLAEALELIADADIYAGSRDDPEWRSRYEPRLLELASAVEAHFDSKLLAQIFVRPEGHLAPGLDLALPDKSVHRPNCNCILFCAQPHALCLYPPGGCREVPGCGFIGLADCTRICGIAF